jgi:hypothetical protein
VLITRSIAATAALCAATDVFAADWSFTGAYSTAFKTLFTAALPVLAYLLLVHIAAQAGTGRRVLPLSSGAVTGGFAGLAVAALLVWLGELPGTAVIGGQQVTGYMTWGGQNNPVYHPLPADWRTGPLLFAAGYTLTVCGSLLKACGTWKAPAVPHIGAVMETR